MDIVSRIKLFLSEHQIANSQFADKCDISRPTISQLLNGRNKKVSDEVISKIHAAYPNLSIMWLMFGEEPMLLSPMPEDDTAEPSLFGNPEAATVDKRIVFASDELPEENVMPKETGGLSQTLETIVKNIGKSDSTAQNSQGGRRIVNVMVLYSDNSFESFVPSYPPTMPASSTQ